MKESTSLRLFPFRVIGIGYLLGTFTYRPVFADSSVSLSVFSCKCCCFWDIRQRSSPKSKSARHWVSVHCVLVFPSLVVSSMTQSITIRKITGEIKQPCLTPVFMSKGSVSFPLWITWHVALLYSCWMRFTKTVGIPLWCNSFHMTPI